MNPSPRSTLFGVATGTPDGGVAVVRISGPDARAVAETLVGPLPVARRLVRRAVVLGAGSDDGLVAWMPGPHSLTGEDVVELHVHAGVRNVEAVCRAVARAGGTAAGPGDFSRRAFELGKLGLDQAEGIAALIAAQSEAALGQARRLASGELGRQVETLRDKLIELAAEVEANLDFPEDVEAESMARWSEELGDVHAELSDWVARFEAGRRARTRPRVVLAGPVNAGKSSLFNALLQRPRALTSAVPGTTRDYVEAELERGGYACTLVDTAGLRSTDDAIERAGVERSGEQIAGADLVVWVEASDSEASGSEASGTPPLGADVILVETKRDLGTARRGWIGASTQGAPGLDAVWQALDRWFRAGVDAPWIGLARHRACAEEAAAAVSEAARHLRSDAALELGAFALGVAARRLGEVTGRTATGPIGEEVLAQIFARFCIGK